MKGIMNQCIVHNWNPRRQRQEQVEGEEEKTSSHVHNHLHNLTTTHIVPMSNFEVTELTWENGQLAMHGLGGLLPTAPTKPTWGRTGDTLESIVHLATCDQQNLNLLPPHDHLHHHNPAPNRTTSSAKKCAETVGHMPMAPGFLKKRMRSEWGKKFTSGIQDDRSACASASASANASATIFKDSGTTMMTWASFESPPQSLKTKTTDEDSACNGGSENQDEEREMKGETGRSHSTRRSRAAAVHNQSERRRRDRINQKMKALQRLVPNASKTDKASMLDEVIAYLKQLQAQVQMMSSARNMPQQMMMPLGMQQHIHMSLLARMGLGVGLGLGMGPMGMLDMSTVTQPQSLSPLLHPATVAAAATAGPTFVPPPFVVPPMMPSHTQAQATSDAAINNSVPFNNPYCAFLAQSMNMDLYNKMAAIYHQQVNQTTQPTSKPLPSSHVQGG
ncbi:hypothetical protein ACSBR2_024119 [Camellia fascicularis]